MKYLFIILIFISTICLVNAKETFQRISVNISLSHPIQKKNYFPDYRYYLDREIEVLLNFRTGKSIALSAGIGLESAEHFRIEEINELRWIESVEDYLPYEITNNWKLNYKSILLPLILEGSMNDSFLDYYIVSNKIGWIFDYDLSEHSTRDVSHIGINKFFLDLSFGIGKKLFQSRNISFDLVPVLGSRFYLSNNNDWQKRYFYYQLKLGIDLFNIYV